MISLLKQGLMQKQLSFKLKTFLNLFWLSINHLQKALKQFFFIIEIKLVFNELE